ncbi:phage terminase large subunit, partial [Ruminococcaceae bacterium OttesenSCG-928-D13]|nr:phage terminase large subunit [Ruminococcaceae bacterium OttesenSCG-928-D13]
MTSVKLSKLIGPAFHGVFKKVMDGLINELVLSGGRGSLKSSFASILVVMLMLMNPQCHAVVLRKVGDKLKNSVYAQIQWAIDMLGLRSQFSYRQSPMEITRKSTGQKILFFGLDDPGKVKSLKLPFGYVGILWFEEFDQFGGLEEIRSVEQSVFRGGPFSFSIKSFNPPAMARHFSNKYAMERRPGKLVHHSTYQEVPPEWLGPRFIADAEHLKATKPINYRHEYL